MMNLFSNMKLKGKLTIAAAALSIIPVILAGGLVGFQSVNSGHDIIKKDQHEKLNAVLNSKKTQIESYLNTLKDQVITLSDDKMTIEAMTAFSKAYKNFRDDAGVSKSQVEHLRGKLASYYNNDFTNAYKDVNSGKSPNASRTLSQLGADAVALQYHFIQANPASLGSKDELMDLNVASSYARTHTEYHHHLRHFLQQFEFYDIFLVDNDGNVVYSVFKELDFATSLTHGPYARSGLAEAFNQVNGKTDMNAWAITDFAAYTPSYEAQAGFIASPIIEHGEKLGVLIMQMPIGKINQMMTSNGKWHDVGLGASGESYLVGSDKTLRSNSRFQIEDEPAYLEALKAANVGSNILKQIDAKDSGIGLQPVESLSATKALAGEHGFHIIPDYRNVPVLSAYAPIEFEGLNWVILAEIDEEEAFAGVEELKSTIILDVLIILLVIGVISIFLAIRGSKSLAAPISSAVRIAGNIAQSNFNNQIAIDRSDEIGDLQQALEQMQSVLFVQITDDKNRAERIKVAMDQLGTNVMIGDTDYNIIYMNNAVTNFLRASATEFRKALPNFDPDPEKLMGTCIDVFHKNPSHQRRLLDNLTGSYTSADLAMGDMTVRVSVSPVLNEAGERIATVVEWIDRTSEVVAEKEVAGIIDAAQAGDLTQRLNTEGKEGFFASLSEGINTLVDVNDRVVNDTLEGMKALEDGDLTHRITNEYQGAFDMIKQANNNTSEKLAEIMGGIISAAREVSTGANEIMDGNNTLSDRTQEQAAALEQTAASIEEMTSTVQQNADNSRQANQLAVSAREQAEDGGKIVSRAVEAMSGITASSKKINDIISVIDEIAFQTNLLALNAAVEAARAGDAGRGFAVVAGEVRTLAGRSAGAAKEIKELISTSVENVEAGSKLVDQSGEALNEIVNSVQKVGDIIAEIAAASQEQSSGIQQINTAITSMDSAVQQNAALVEETSAASSSLNDQASGMSDMVSAFNLGDSGSAAPARQQTRKPAGKKRPASKKPAAQASKKSKPADNDDEWAEF